MSRIPALTPRELVAALVKAGYQEKRQTGSHCTYVHPARQFVVVPVHARDMKRGTMLQIIRRAGFTDDDFLDLL